MEIKNRCGQVIKTVNSVTLAGADLAGADLAGADLARANLRGANLARANLRGANLAGAKLAWANLYRATLYGAKLAGAKLAGANLYGALINWQSHALIAELLRQAAGNDIQKRMIAGLIAVSFDWCWKDFITIESDLKDWALDVLAGHVTDMDVETPHVLVKRGKKPIAIKEEMVRFQEVLMSYLESQRFAE